ncbi:MAG: UDP-N-acetylglucosamine--N-acetylmuramyl-(pentapeptide) pyrophosphoryl-undecaprenol N-acetylglucosamine transferase [Candidatus Beckwithbacteria bacterium]
MSLNLIVLTGSHPTPALALEARLTLAGYKVKQLTVPTPKFNRHQPLRSTISLIKLPNSLIQAYQQLIRLQPTLVVSFGGYQALPVCLAAKLLRLPLIIHEQTFAFGLTSKLTSLIADKIAVSWPSCLKHFPAKKTCLTGNLIRSEILQINRQPASRPTIYITGGHFGSQAINRAVAPILSKLLEKYIIYHQFGLYQVNQPPVINQPHYHLQTWFTPTQLKKIYSQVDLVISRSGINTVTELAYLRIPAVLIPLTTAQKNEQQTNAKFMQSLGLALILNQTQLTPKTLLQTIDQAIKILPQKSSQSFDRNLVSSAADKLYELVIKLINHEV